MRFNISPFSTEGIKKKTMQQLRSVNYKTLATKRVNRENAARTERDSTKTSTPSAPPSSNTRQANRQRTAAQRWEAVQASNATYMATLTTPEQPWSTIPRHHRANVATAKKPEYTYSTPDQHSDLSYGAAMRSPNKDAFQLAYDAEMIRQIEDYKCLVAVDKVPAGKQVVSYANPRFKTKTGEADQTTYHCRQTFGGDKASTGDSTYSSTSTMEEVKLFLTGAVSDNANLSAIDITAFFLNTPLQRYAYLRMPYAQASPNLIKKYGWEKYQQNGAIIFEVRKAMYGMDDASRKSFQMLEKCLRADGYNNTERNPNLFRHNNNGVAFTLVVDDLCVKWSTQEGWQHLLQTLRKTYDIKVQEKIKRYIGFTINYDQVNRTIDLTMPGYADNMMTTLQVINPKFVSSPAEPPSFNPNSKAQRTQPDTTAPRPDKKKWLQQLAGFSMYFARAVNYAIKTAVSKLAQDQAEPTEASIRRAERLCAYIFHHRDPTLRLIPCDMQVQAHSDASFLGESKGRSRYSYTIWLGKPVTHNADNYVPNITQFDTGIISNVVTSVAESEYTALYKCTLAVLRSRGYVEDMGYPQRTTVIYVDNECAKGLANRTCQDKHLKHIDMRLHFTREKVDTKEIAVEWIPTKDNIADFGTKNLATDEFKRKCGNFLYTNYSYLKGELVPDSATGSIMPHATNKSRNRPRAHHHMPHPSLMHAPKQLART